MESRRDPGSTASDKAAPAVLSGSEEEQALAAVERFFGRGHLGYDCPGLKCLRPAISTSISTAPSTPTLTPSADWPTAPPPAVGQVDTVVQPESYGALSLAPPGCEWPSDLVPYSPGAQGTNYRRHAPCTFEYVWPPMSPFITTLPEMRAVPMHPMLGSPCTLLRAPADAAFGRADGPHDSE